MLSRDMLSAHWALWKLSMILDRFPSVVFIALLAGGAAAKYMAIAATNGGDDLLYSDIPRSIMLLQGRDPYLVAQWHSPYPPFLFVVVGGILWIAGGGGLQSGSNPALLSVETRLAGLVADLLVGFLIFLVLRFQRCSGLGLLGPVGLYLFLPPIGLLPYSVFHADIFGRLIMAAALLVLVLGRYFVGTVLLTVSVIFKVHPLLALLPLLMRGRLLQSVIICGILEFTNILGGWVFNIPGNPFPEMSSVYGFFITSLVYAILNTLTLVFVLRSSTRLVSRDWTAPSLTSKQPLHKVS